MSVTVCLCGNALSFYYPSAGGLEWMYLNWALGFRRLGCRVIWLEAVKPSTTVHELQAGVKALRSRLKRYNVTDEIALCSRTIEPLPKGATKDCLDLDAATEADLLWAIGIFYLPAEVVRRFRRSAWVDGDPGGTQIWLGDNSQMLEPYDMYFTYGETVGKPGALFPDCGVNWLHTPPCVDLDYWPMCNAAQDSSFTTVAHWFGEWMVWNGECFQNDKRSGFLPYLDLPKLTAQPLELAINLGDDHKDERLKLEERGWRLRESSEIASTPWDYQRYVQESRGEFSCAKPHYVRLQTAWISERTLNYLATGKPAIVQHTGPSRFLPDTDGLFRFRDLDEAACCIEAAVTDYERHCKIARVLIEEYFDAKKVARRVLERAVA